jgi:hypothetical protein
MIDNPVHNDILCYEGDDLHGPTALGMAEMVFSSGRLRRAVPDKCAKCHFDNPADTRLFGHCGTQLPGTREDESNTPELYIFTPKFGYNKILTL